MSKVMFYGIIAAERMPKQAHSLSHGRGWGKGAGGIVGWNGFGAGEYFGYDATIGLGRGFGEGYGIMANGESRLLENFRCQR